MSGRLLGLDIASKRIGVAISDETGMLASPVSVVARGRGDRAAFAELVARYRPTALVAGLPTGLSGREGPQAQETRVYAEALAHDLDLPLEYWDERLSTAFAERSMIDAGMRRDARKERIDAAAAAVMLQGYLDSQRNRRNRPPRSGNPGETG
jgi:putative holliday junction resolvase